MFQKAALTWLRGYCWPLLSPQEAGLPNPAPLQQGNPPAPRPRKLPAMSSDMEQEPSRGWLGADGMGTVQE